MASFYITYLISINGYFVYLEQTDTLHYVLMVRLWIFNNILWNEIYFQLIFNLGTSLLTCLKPCVGMAAIQYRIRKSNQQILIAAADALKPVKLFYYK